MAAGEVQLKLNDMMKSKGQKIVRRWDVFELALEGPLTGNPFIDTELTAEFSCGDRSLQVEGFYDGDGIYRVRFQPDEEGHWEYATRSNRSALNGKRGSFECGPASRGEHGPVRVRGQYHFEYADGTPYSCVGTTCYGWAFRSPAMRKKTLESLAKARFNKLRMIVTPFASCQTKKFPFEKKADGTWDFERFDPAFFGSMERQIAAVRKLGIVADLILFHPYDKGRWGFDRMPSEVNLRYIRYCIARYGAMSNVWWSVANEYDFVRTRKESEWEKFGRTIGKYDPYGRCCSIHNGTKIFNHRRDWITHASMQNGSAVADYGRARIYRDVFGMPVVYDEVCYEGNHTNRWGRLSGQEMTERFWHGTIAGTYVGHSEAWKKDIPTDSSWVGAGGELQGQSYRRIGFLREIVESHFPRGIEPLHRDLPETGGEKGRKYIVYFGRKKAGQWRITLPAKGLAEGARCTVEEIDTWNMKTRPLKGEYVLRLGENGYLSGDVVKLAARPYMAAILTISE